ncbi:MAG: Derepression protein [Hafnia sp.]|uniref:Derepression protein n=1 Tax=Hafnia sp. TaxID=1873498 RepID=UPI002FC7E65B
MATVHIFAHPNQSEPLSPELHHKLNRAHAVAQFTATDMLRQPLSCSLSALYMPYILSYLASDLHAISQELRERGLLISDDS